MTTPSTSVQYRPSTLPTTEPSVSSGTPPTLPTTTVQTVARAILPPSTPRLLPVTPSQTPPSMTLLTPPPTPSTMPPVQFRTPLPLLATPLLLLPATPLLPPNASPFIASLYYRLPLAEPPPPPSLDPSSPTEKYRAKINDLLYTYRCSAGLFHVFRTEGSWDRDDTALEFKTLDAIGQYIATEVPSALKIEAFTYVIAKLIPTTIAALNWDFGYDASYFLTNGLKAILYSSKPTELQIPKDIMNDLLYKFNVLDLEFEIGDIGILLLLTIQEGHTRPRDIDRFFKKFKADNELHMIRVFNLLTFMLYACGQSKQTCEIYLKTDFRTLLCYVAQFYLRKGDVVTAEKTLSLFDGFEEHIDKCLKEASAEERKEEGSCSRVDELKVLKSDINHHRTKVKQAIDILATDNGGGGGGGGVKESASRKRKDVPE